MGRKIYNTIFFDWNKTLSNSLFWNQLADPGHIRHDWHENIVNFVFVENKHLINDWMRAKFNEEYIADLIFERYGYLQDVVIGDLAESCKNMQLVSDEIFGLINKIREKGIKCVIATDNMDTFIKYTKPAMKLECFFDDFLVSFDEKVLKFDVDNDSIPFFTDYLERNQLSYRDVLLVDDCIDKSGTYSRLGFDILQVLSPDDFLVKLRKMAE